MSHHAYLAGPMRNFPRFNFDAFHEAAANLRRDGWRVTSPAEMDEQLGFDPDGPLGDFDLQDAMRRDVQAICKVDSIILLPGWRKSEGAQIELTVAKALGLWVYEYVHAYETPDSDYRLVPPEGTSGGTETAPQSETPPPTSTSICAEADRLVDTDRGAVYGHPSQDFGRTGKLWADFLGLPEPLAPWQVGLMMVLLKVSRLAQTPDHRDSLVDIAGYAKTVDMCREAS